MPDTAPAPRFFVPPEGASAGAAFVAGRHLALPPTEAHHAAHVLRLKVGDAVELFDGRGGVAAGRIVGSSRHEVVVGIEEPLAPATAPRPRIHLAFAVPKGRRLDWLLEKATELGVESLAPVRFARSVAGAEALSPAKRQRWLGHCIAAAKQARTAFLPVVEDARPLDAFLAGVGPGLYGDLADAATAVRDVLDRHAGAEALHVVVGPEGGLTEAERLAMQAAGLEPARLGQTTLRVETAAIALVAAVRAYAR